MKATALRYLASPSVVSSYESAKEIILAAQSVIIEAHEDCRVSLDRFRNTSWCIMCLVGLRNADTSEITEKSTVAIFIMVMVPPIDKLPGRLEI